jgi:hypothetical protein
MFHFSYGRAALQRDGTKRRVGITPSWRMLALPFPLALMTALASWL